MGDRQDWDGVERRRSPGDFLAEARESEMKGRVLEAMQACQSAIELADPQRDGAVLAEALRRLASLRRRRHEAKEALELCQRSFDVATAIGSARLAAEARNGLALIHLGLGQWEDARRALHTALILGSESDRLRAQIQQNLGIMANAEGDLEAAREHYEKSLALFMSSADQSGVVIAYNNLGMLNSDHGNWAEADKCFRTSLDMAEQIGDVRHRAHALLNHTEVHIARADFESAKKSAEEALQIFDDMGQRDFKSAAYKFLGVIYRETGRPMLAESRMRTALDMSTEVGATLIQAETSREMAILYQQMGRNQETLKLLTSAHRLFGRLNARRDLVDVTAKTSHLEGIYLEIVQDWGASIESSDTYTHGHSERVAEYAVRVAVALGLQDAELTTIRVGAYLHDLGKVRVPHEVLNKAGKLTPDEFDMMKMHPVHGIEMLAAIEFPWDIKPIIRSHHEKLDGSGYPDKLRGDEIPVYAQIIGIVDVFDALTSTRSYRSALSQEQAVGIMLENPQHYRPEVFAAFMDVLGAPSATVSMPGADAATQGTKVLPIRPTRAA